jgi:hypothetical protein
MLGVPTLQTASEFSQKPAAAYQVTEDTTYLTEVLDTRPPCVNFCRGLPHLHGRDTIMKGHCERGAESEMTEILGNGVGYISLYSDAHAHLGVGVVSAVLAGGVTAAPMSAGYNLGVSCLWITLMLLLVGLRSVCYVIVEDI